MPEQGGKSGLGVVVGEGGMSGPVTLSGCRGEGAPIPLAPGPSPAAGVGCDPAGVAEVYAPWPGSPTPSV